jgi:hypothetical protein
MNAVTGCYERHEWNTQLFDDMYCGIFAQSKNCEDRERATASKLL